MLEYKLYQGDCFTILDSIEDNTIDLVLTDPPYGIDWKEQIKFNNKKAYYSKGFDELKEWDLVDIKELYNKLFPILTRVTKDTGSIILFTRNENVTYAIESAAASGFYHKACIYWVKTNPVPQVRKRNYLSSVETIVWSVKTKDSFTFNFSTQKEMLNYIQMPLCQGKERTEHPAQKPLALIKKLMAIHSNKEDTILDNFLGSGTTMKAAIETGRNCIGIEANKKYILACKERCGFNNTRLFNNAKYVFSDAYAKI